MPTVEDILSEQSRRPLFVTMKAVEDNPETVKITPWTSSGGCHCGLSVEVPKDSIEDVAPSNERHVCCGESFIVVEVEFKEGASISLNELTRQLGSAAAQTAHANQRAAALAARRAQVAGPCGGSEPIPVQPATNPALAAQMPAWPQSYGPIPGPVSPA